MARSTQKKKAKKGNTLQDFIFILSTISILYERQGDAGRAKSFKVASENLTKFAELTSKSGTVLKSSADYKNVKGVGKSTLEMMDEFIKTGTCSRLEELEGAGKQVALVREGEDQSGLELGVFCDEDDNEDYLFLYDPEDEYPLYTNIEEYFREELDEAQQDEVNDWDGMGAVNDVREDIIDTHKGLLCLAEDYRDDWQKFYFVRKATSKDLKRKEWKGQADRNCTPGATFFTFRVPHLESRLAVWRKKRVPRELVYCSFTKLCLPI